jgi:hypothetical protein
VRPKGVETSHHFPERGLSAPWQVVRVGMRSYQ